MAYPPEAIPYQPYVKTRAITLADTEYSFQFPEKTKRFMLHTRDESLFRLAFESGYVAAPTDPYLTVLADLRYFSYEVNLRPNDAAWDGTVYFASADADKVMEIHYWMNDLED